MCAVAGAPIPNITWLKNEKPIDLSDKDARFENGVCTLTVFTTSQEDAGMYICEATNIHGSNRSTSLVEVKRRFLDKYCNLLLFPLLWTTW